ncbi:MAG TPA: cell division protein FtsZ, partial [Desulfobulbus sp.]|nr:cell division protein FtsZ [Desulfobulbus sp.]
IDGARGILINISAAQETLTMAEFMEASALIQDKAHDDANIIIGALFDESLGDELRVTVIATGISSIEESETISQIDMVHSTPASREESGPSLSSKLAEEPPQPESRPVSMAKPNPAPAGLRPMPKPIFDDHEQDDYDEPAYLRKKAN